MNRYIFTSSNTQKTIIANSKKEAIQQVNTKPYKQAKTFKEKADADFVILDESLKVYFYNYKVSY